MNDLRERIECMTEAGLPTWVHNIARRMIADFDDSAEIQHRASKGTERERTVVQYLNKYAPGHVRVVPGGEVRAVDGQVSPQQDIMIVDLMTPPLFAGEAIQVVPAECVYCVGEVKSNLDSDELAKAWASSRAVKHMPKTAFRGDRLGPSRGSGRLHEYGELQWTFPTASFVFAYDSIALTTVAERIYALAAYHASIDGDRPQHFIDAVFVLKKGFIYWGVEEDQKLLRRPEPGALPCVVESSEPGQVLVAMTSWFSGVLTDARMPRFDIDAYFGSTSIGDELNWYRPGGPPIVATLPLPNDAAGVSVNPDPSED